MNLDVHYLWWLVPGGKTQLQPIRNFHFFYVLIEFIIFSMAMWLLNDQSVLLFFSQKSLCSIFSHGR